MGGAADSEGVDGVAIPGSGRQYYYVRGFACRNYMSRLRNATTSHIVMIRREIYWQQYSRLIKSDMLVGRDRAA